MSAEAALASTSQPSQSCLRCISATSAHAWSCRHRARRGVQESREQTVESRERDFRIPHHKVVTWLMCNKSSFELESLAGFAFWNYNECVYEVSAPKAETSREGPITRLRPVLAAANLSRRRVCRAGSRFHFDLRHPGACDPLFPSPAPRASLGRAPPQPRTRRVPFHTVRCRAPFGTGL